MRHLGSLSAQDPLYGFLRDHILPSLVGWVADPHFEVCQARASNTVYRYHEKKSGLYLIGKFFWGSKNRSWPEAEQQLEREWSNLCYVRSLGFDHKPHYVVRPIATYKDFSCLLLEEYCKGTSLSDYIREGIKGHGDRLFRKLTHLATFLAHLHNSTAVGEPVNFRHEQAYGNHMVHVLLSKNLISWEDAQALWWQIGRFNDRPAMWSDCHVVVHGDCTPANFLFGHHDEVIAIDLERLKRSDRVFDLGRVAGELKHKFLEVGSAEGSEPFIGHFIWEYCTHFPDRHAAFASITERLPFYIALNLLRIARNDWVSHEHRKKIIAHAFLNLHHGH